MKVAVKLLYLRNRVLEVVGDLEKVEILGADEPQFEQILGEKTVPGPPVGPVLLVDHHHWQNARNRRAVSA